MAKRPETRSTATDPAAAPAAAKPKRARATTRPAAARDNASNSGPTVDDIRLRAYERYLERGGNHGQHFDDWLEAEKELRNRK